MPDVQWFIDNGCELTHPNLNAFFAVFGLSQGQPCKECNCKDTCPAWPKLNTPTPSAPDIRPRCSACHSLLNPVKVARRGGKCACGAVV